MANQKGCIDFLANEKSFYEIHTENSCYVQEMKQVLQKIEEFGKMVLSHAWRDANTQERIAAVVVDALFCLIAIVYSSNVLEPLPMTYLSEILFPWDFCIKQIACSIIFCLRILALIQFETTSWDTTKSNHKNYEKVLILEVIAWGMSSMILWMEHRRGRIPSVLLRVFWLLKWADASCRVFFCDNAILAQMIKEKRYCMADITIYTCECILAISCFMTSTPITVDMINIRTRADTASAYLRSFGVVKTNLNYGSFQSYEIISRPKNKKDEDTTPISIGPPISISIPSSTTTMWGKTQFVSYKIVVKTEDDRWSVRRQYNEFALLHGELPKEVRQMCKLPEDSTRKILSWKGRPRSLKSKLEQYLRQILDHPMFEPNRSQAFCDFLEMEYIEDALVRSYHSRTSSSTDIRTHSGR